VFEELQAKTLVQLRIIGDEKPPAGVEKNGPEERTLYTLLTNAGGLVG
tara:strand:+ start:497 stop:640 length:144 start_codon:yes stop_codon:yes gene_type:complete